MSHVHVIDRDHRRRAQIAREMLARGFHSEIYEGAEEFAEVAPRDGYVFSAMEELPGVLDSMTETSCELPLVVYAQSPSTAVVVEAIHNGALDFLDWPFTAQGLGQCLDRLATEGKRKLARLQKQAEARNGVARLSERETDVLSAMVRGGSNKSIAADLGISPRTVEIHRANMMKKLNAESTADAVRMALLAGVDDWLEFAA